MSDQQVDDDASSAPQTPISVMSKYNSSRLKQSFKTINPKPVPRSMSTVNALKGKPRGKKGVKVFRTAIVQEYSVKVQPNGFVHTFYGPVKKQVECFKKYETQ